MKKTIKKNSIKKNGPNYELAKEQLLSLNKEFYNNYLNGYFLLKITDLVDKLSNPNEYIDYIKNKKFEIGKLKFENSYNNENDIVDFAKIELIDSYYHGLESFIRIFIAHATLKECPWIEMSGLSMSKYKSAIERLANDDFEWLNDKFNGDITVLFVLTGYDKMPENITQEDLKGFRNWVSWIAKELLNHKEHNSYKHGLTVFTKLENISLSDKTTTLFSFNGDAIQTLQTEEKKERFVWVKSSKYIKYDEYGTILHVIANFINNIIYIGKFHYINAEYKIGWLPNKDLNPIMILSGSDLSDQIGIQGLKCIMHGSKQELSYYK